MSILTLDSTFNDIKNLLKDDDICFKKIIKKIFEKVSKDEELKNAFCFFMAMALGEWELLMRKVIMTFIESSWV